MNKHIFMLKFFSILFLILFLNGCGNGETSHADEQPIAPMANDGSYQLALDTSLTKFRLGFPCKYLAVSSNSTGQALAYVDSNWNMPILLYPGYSGLVDAKESLYVDVGPQPGKILQLFFGDSPIISSPAAKFASDPAISILNFIKARTTVAITSDTIVSQANNLNGIKILGGIVASRANPAPIGDTFVSTLYMTDGTFFYYIMSAQSYTNGTNYSFNANSIPQIYIPPNYGLLWQSIITAAQGQNNIILNYQLL